MDENFSKNVQHMLTYLPTYNNDAYLVKSPPYLTMGSPAMHSRQLGYQLWHSRQLICWLCTCPPDVGNNGDSYLVGCKTDHLITNLAVPKL
jgi:hypothetical protein